MAERNPLVLISGEIQELPTSDTLNRVGKLIEDGVGFSVDNGSTRPTLGTNAVDLSYTTGGVAGASGNYSHAEGSNTTASGNHSHAEGTGTTASGIYSHAEGLNATADGDYSHAEGYDTTASGNYSHAEGSNTTASGDYSHAEGTGTTASGSFSHAEGLNATADGNYSHAEGTGTTASGNYSHAQNYGTVAQGYAQTVIGQHNVAQGTPLYPRVDTDNAFIIGNGTGYAARSNALAVTWEGDITVAGDVTDGTGNVLSDKAAVGSTTPSTQAYGDSAATGTSSEAARVDHKHAMPATTKDKTAVTGILKGNGTDVTAAAAGTDYYAPSGTDVAIADGGTSASTATAGVYNLINGLSEVTIADADRIPFLDASGSTAGYVQKSNLAPSLLYEKIRDITDTSGASISIDVSDIDWDVWAEIYLILPVNANSTSTNIFLRLNNISTNSYRYITLNPGTTVTSGTNATEVIYGRTTTTGSTPRVMSIRIRMAGNYCYSDSEAWDSSGIGYRKLTWVSLGAALSTIDLVTGGTVYLTDASLWGIRK